MLRPATPLAIILLVAFVLLLLATISTPIIKGIPLATLNGVDMGVFGYCTPTKCTSIQVGYSVSSQALFGNSNENQDFSLPASTRSSLSSILIVHPVAALLVLACFVMAVAAHFHGPSHSTRFLIAIVIVSIPALLITLLAFLVDLLLFVPHLAWGGWIVLVSTILILVAGIITCAMRRTLVNRKERKRRIAENPEMNGANFYANQNPVPQGVPNTATTATVPSTLRADSPPPLVSDKLPNFTTYEKDRPLDDDRTPLNSRQRTPPRYPGGPGGYDGGYDRRRAGPRGGMRGGGRGGAPFRGPRDEYGNPLPPSDAFGPPPPPGMRRDRSEPPMRRGDYNPDDPYARPRGGGGGGYGRGGYGRGGPRGGPGGYGRPPPGGFNGRGPPPSYNNGGGGYGPPGSSGMGGAMAAGAVGGAVGAAMAGHFGRSESAPAYGRGGPGRQQSPAPMYGRGPTPPSQGAQGYGYDGGYGGPGASGVQPYRTASPAPSGYNNGGGNGGGEMIGQAIEMDARHGSRASPVPRTAEFGQPQAQGLAPPQAQGQGEGGHMSMTSVYSQEYVPARANWRPTTSHLNPATSNNTSSSQLAGSGPHSPPIELPVHNTARSPPQPQTSSSGGPTPSGRARARTSEYYEDIDPRFSNELPSNTSSGLVPAPLSTTERRPAIGGHDGPVSPDGSYGGGGGGGPSFGLGMGGRQTPSHGQAF